jgi:Fe-S cluster assembly iron-binding protein IscA
LFFYGFQIGFWFTHDGKKAYVKNGLNEGFEFNNPNKKGECGCGESFTV